MKMWYDYCQDTRTSRGEKRVDREEIFEYVKKQYGTIPEYLWSSSPDSAVLCTIVKGVDTFFKENI